MRSVTYRLTPSEGYYGRIGRFFAENSVWVIAIHNIDSLRDESVVTQFEVAGSKERIQECLEGEGDWVRNYEFTSTGDNLVFQMHFKPTGLHRDVYELHRSYPVLLDYPIEVVDQESQTFRVVEVGMKDDLRRLINETRNKIDVEIEQVSPYKPLDQRSYTELTQRQQEVVNTAIDLGYYDSPRTATYSDIANELGCSESAVGQHLRRAESKVMSALSNTGSALKR